MKLLRLKLKGMDRGIYVSRLVILEAVIPVVKGEQQPVEHLLRAAVRRQVELVRARVHLGQDGRLHVVVAQPACM